MSRPVNKWNKRKDRQKARESKSFFGATGNRPDYAQHFGHNGRTDAARTAACVKKGPFHVT
jgi:hypothetical protein